MCTMTNNEIVLLHSRFNNGSESTGTCNNGSIVGEIIELNGNNYTSQLNITFDPFLIGKTVECVSDDGENTISVANYTIINDIGMLNESSALIMSTLTFWYIYAANTHANSTDVEYPGIVNVICIRFCMS